jgi:hypothetical protein
VLAHLGPLRRSRSCETWPEWIPGRESLDRELMGWDPQKAHGAIMFREETRVKIKQEPPRPDLIGPVQVNCPKCGHDLGPQVRVTLESAWSASKRSTAREAYLVCPHCRKAWVAALWLSIAAYAGSEVAA